MLKYIRGPSLDSRRIFLPFFRNFDFKGGGRGRMESSSIFWTIFFATSIFKGGRRRIVVVEFLGQIFFG